MSDDSLRRTLGLAQAILEWTDPLLLDALRAADALVGPEDLRRWGRDPLEGILDRRARPERGRVRSLTGPPEAVVALDRAWDAVVNALRLKIERGEICLSARMTRPEMRMEPESIPSSWATELDFDVRGAAIFVRDETYVAVTAMKPIRAKRVAGASEDAGKLRDLRGDAEHLSLLKAMTSWCDAKLVARIQDEERKLIAYELHQYSMPKLLDESEWRQPSRNSLGATDYVFLTAAWNNLTRDFRRRVESSELYLEGVLSGDDPAAQPETIPNFWAAQLKLDLHANAVARGQRTYLAVTVSKTPSPWAPVEQKQSDAGATVSRQPITSEVASHLTDDEVFTLLNEYARRVVEEEGSSLKLPVKVSFLPILRRKMRHRFETGENAITLGAEADALERWIKGKADGHQTPTARHIENELRDEHRQLKAQHPRPGFKDGQS